jgi:hypothetical protein
MNTHADKLRLKTEHKEFVKDLTNVIISYTPISGISDTLKFTHKWFGKKRVGHRVARFMKVRERKNYIKSRTKRIIASQRRPFFKYF